MVICIQIAIYTLHRQHLTLNIAHNELIYCSTAKVVSVKLTTILCSFIILTNIESDTFSFLFQK